MPSIPPYFRAMYPQEAAKLDQGYSDLGKVMGDFFRRVLTSLNPFRTP